MARFAALTTFSHYHDHLWPIIEALRASGHTVDDLTNWRNADFAGYVHPKDLGKFKPDLWLTAGLTDAEKVAPAPTVYVEHGAGQTYEADLRGAEKRDSYSTGTIPNAVLYLCPNLFVQSRRARTGVPAVAVGSPRLDQYPIGQHEGVERAVAFAWHWNQEMIPETQSALDHYLDHMTPVAIGLRRRGYLPVVHAHPRIAKRARWHLERKGFEWWDVDDVMTKAAVLCADNTSLLYEFAHVDRPIVVLNAPWYRKHVHHGLRFWECVPGGEVEDAGDLLEAIGSALEEDLWAPQRKRCAELVFPLNDGKATHRAVVSIEALLATR